MAMHRPVMILLEDPDAFPENVGAVIHLDDKAQRVGPGMYRKRILRYGRWSHTAAPDGVLDVDEGYGKKLVNNFAAKVFDTVQAVKGHPKNDAERIANAAGSVVALDDAGGPDGPGVYATVSVPPEVDAEIQEGKLVGCSAGIIPNYSDHEIGGKGAVGPVLDHLAFTNTPYIKGLGGFAPVHLADDTQTVLLSPADAPTKETIVDRAELIAQAKTLGIDIETLEQTAALVPDLQAKVDKAPDADAVKEAAKAEVAVALGEALTGSGLITLGEGESLPDLGTLVAKVGTTLAEGRNAATALRLSEANAAIDKAVADGKIILGKNEEDGSNKVRAAQVKLFLSDKETWEAVLPKVALVQLGELGTTGSDEDPTVVTLADGTVVDDEVKRLLELSENI